MSNIRYITLLVLITLLGGCERSILDDELDTTTSSELQLSLCSSSMGIVGGTRAEGEVSELIIRRGYIFVFSADGLYKGYQAVQQSDVTSNNTSYPVITTTISGYDSSVDKVIAVFNYSTDDFVGEDSFSDMTPQSVSDYFPLDGDYLAALQADFSAGDYLLGMPMYVNDFANTSGRTTHDVYRALSRIELYVNATEVSTSLLDHSHSFTPENVKYTIVNAAQSGLIGFTSTDEVAGICDGATYQEGDEISFDSTPLSYSSTDNIASLPSSSSAIYLYEFPYSTQVIGGDGISQGLYDPERLSILIEHIDEEAHPGVVFYYKLQLVDKTTNEYYDIRRNYDYRVVITDVYSDGYTDLYEAYVMPPSNIEYEIFDDQGDLTFSNGQYAISMDEVLNYESILIYGPETTTISFENIRRILPSEVVDPLSDEELAEMTNIVDFSIVSEDGVTVEVLQNDFEDDARLTDDGRSIILQLSGEGECSIQLKIQLGNLSTGFDEITIEKVGSSLGGDSSFDAHPCQLRIENQNVITGTWNSIDSDFGARNDGDDLIIYMGENATPVGYKSLNGYISSGAASNAYPYFEPKTREGYFSYYDLENDPEKTTVKKSKIVLGQLAPFYVGHFGSAATAGPHYYDALIVEKIEEIEDDRYTPVEPNGGLLNWSEQSGKIYYVREKIYGSYLGLDKYLNFVEGRDISEYIVQNNTAEGSLPTAARYCYMKNDINGDGVIGDDEPIVWFLPASNQMLALWISKHLIDMEVDAEYFGFHLEEDSNPWYWTTSEVAPTLWDLSNYTFENTVARFNMLEGEMNIIGMKGKNGYDDLAHVRCVRGIIYDNTK